MGDLFGKRPQVEKTRDTERGELMKKFMSRLNPPRLAKRMRPLTYPWLGKKLEGIPTKDLYYLYTVCDDSKNFSARFWWELDPKKHETPIP